MSDPGKDMLKSILEGTTSIPEAPETQREVPTRVYGPGKELIGKRIRFKLSYLSYEFEGILNGREGDRLFTTYCVIEDARTIVIWRVVE